MLYYYGDVNAPHNLFLQRPPRDESVDVHHFLLSNTMSPIHSLGRKRERERDREGEERRERRISFAGCVCVSECVHNCTPRNNVYATLVLSKSCPKQTCRSFMGFQSCSKKMTVSAPVRLRPKPPTWVVSRRTSTDGSTLNLEEGVRNAGDR